MYRYTADNGDIWEIYQDNSNEWRWRRTSSNGEIVGASTQGYKNKSDCASNAKRNGLSFTLEQEPSRDDEKTLTTSDNGRKGECTQSDGEIWKFSKDLTWYDILEWGWSLFDKNGQLLEVSQNVYKNKSDCIADAKSHGMTCDPKF